MIRLATASVRSAPAVFLSTLRSWAYRAAPGDRDRRLDLLRGLCLVTMMVDHISGDSLLTPLTGNNHFVVSAAEGFVFISGVVFGIVNRSRLARLGLRASILKALYRGGCLYSATTVLTLAMVALLEFTKYPLWIDRNVPLGVPRPIDAVSETLTIHFTYQGTEILAMYIFFFLAAPIALALLNAGRTRVLLAASLALWLAFQIWPAQLIIPWSAANAGNFPFAAWQILFMFGLAIGYHRAELTALARRLPMNRIFVGVTVGFAIVVELNSLAERKLLGGFAPDTPLFEAIFHKVNLAPGRLLAFALVALFFYLAVSHLWRPLQLTVGRALIPLGQNTLFGYGFHLFLLGLAPFVVPWGPPDNPWIYEINTARQLVVIVPVCLGVAVLLLARRFLAARADRASAAALLTGSRSRPEWELSGSATVFSGEGLLAAKVSSSSTLEGTPTRRRSWAE
jgi:hypothetical protein